MNRSLLVVFFIFISSTIFCQQDSTVSAGKNRLPFHAFGDFSLSGSADILFNTPNGVQLAGGIKISTFVSKRISFDSDLVAGSDYFHMGPGIIGIPIWLLLLESVTGVNGEATTFQEFLLYAFFIVLSTEHISYHIPVKNMIDISPYISILRYKHAYEFGYHPDDPGYAGDQFSYAVGVQMNKYFHRFMVSPYAEVNVGYSDHIPGINIGVYCGYYFPNR